MKKVLALILALLMLGTVTAFAENTTLYTFSDPVLDVEAEGETMHLALDGLSFAVAPVTVNGEDVYALNIRGDGKPLLAAAFRLVDDKVVFDVDGLSHSYSAPVMGMSGNGGSAVPELNIDTDALLATLLGSAQLDMDGDTIRFVLPYNAVNELALQLLPTVLESVSLPEGADPNEVLDAIKEMQETDSGVTITGSFTQSENGMSAYLEFTAVEKGESGDAPALTASMVIDDAFSMDITAEGMTFHMGILPDTGMIEVTVKSEDLNVAFTGRFGTEEGEIKVAELGDPAAAIPVDSMGEQELEELGGEAMMAFNDLLGFLYPVLEQLI